MDAVRFDLRDIAPQPWKNGAGLTREIARSDALDHRIGASGNSGTSGDSEFDWRISLAEVERDAPFSAFPGVDRCIVLLRGAGMRLHARDGSFDHRLTETLSPFRFSGDVTLDAELIDGHSSDFNVMTKRGSYRSEVVCHRERTSPTGLDGAAVVLVLCCAGEWLVGEGEPRDTHSLGPFQGLVWRRPPSTLMLQPAGKEYRPAMLLVSVWHDHIA